MNSPSKTSTRIDVGFAPPPLPVMGFPGTRVMKKSAMNTAVPAIPIPYHTFPQRLIMGIIQKTWAIPPRMKRIPWFTLNPKIFGASIRCNMPAIAVAAAAA